jgi:hypothetical protein
LRLQKPISYHMYVSIFFSETKFSIITESKFKTHSFSYIAFTTFFVKHIGNEYDIDYMYLLWISIIDTI